MHVSFCNCEFGNFERYVARKDLVLVPDSRPETGRTIRWFLQRPEGRGVSARMTTVILRAFSQLGVCRKCDAAGIA